MNEKRLIFKIICYYFDDIMRAKNWDIYSSDILGDEKLCKENHADNLIMTFHSKLQRVQNHCVLCLMK